MSYSKMLVAVCTMTLLLASSQAQAKGIFLITHGDTISTLGSIDSKDHTSDIPAGLKVGYKSSYAGVFWIDFWTWGGEYCVFEGAHYQSISKETAAKLLGISAGSVSPPLLYRYPLGLVIVGGIVGLSVLGAIFKAVKNKTTI